MTFTTGCYAVLPMFPVRSVTYVPGLCPRVRSPRLLTAAFDALGKGSNVPWPVAAGSGAAAGR